MSVVATRLGTQRLIPDRRAATAVEVVRDFAAVQAQDYRGALWGIAQRTRGATEADVEAAIAARAIVRTWPMRGTLHFVVADDARWITRLLAPRIVKRAARRYAELELDARTFTRSRTLLEAALGGGQTRTRPELYAALARGKVSPAGQRGVHILGRLAMDGVLCIAAPRGAQQTFALLDDWLPRTRELTGDAAHAELATRYVASRGPARLVDLAWWTGWSQGEAQRALAAAQLAPDRDGLYAIGAPRTTTPATAHLLPAYDEYTVAYRDRSYVLMAAHAARAGNGIFKAPVLLHGTIVGTWTRRIAKRVTLAIMLFAPPTRVPQAALAAAAARYAKFLGREVDVDIAS